MQIKENDLKGMPFKLKTRYGIATVFSYYGDNEEVGELMQKISHMTRAYYVNINGFKGFIKPSLITILWKEKQELVKVTEH